MIDLVALGLIPPNEELLPWLIVQAGEYLPELVPILCDPAGSLGRLGDLLVLNSETGQYVIAALEDIAESQSRIESVVANIESATIATRGALGALHALSMTTLGVTSLSSAFMLCRMQALRKRLDYLATQVKDIQAHLNAQTAAHLGSALDFLRCYEDGEEREADLRRALEASNYAANVYGNLVRQETQGPRRHLLLQHSLRCHVLSAMVEARCLMLTDNLKQAAYRLTEEMETARKAARVIFISTVDNHLPRYTERCFGCGGISLSAMAELYRTAREVGIISRPRIATVDGMLEHLHSRGYGGRLKWSRTSVQDLLNEWKCAAAAVEETARIASLRLRVEWALNMGFSLREFETQVAGNIRELSTSSDMSNVCVLAFGDLQEAQEGP